MNPSSQWVFSSTRRAIADPAIRRALGPLAALSDDQAITDIFVTSDGRVFADRGSGAVVVTGLQLGQSESTDLARGLECHFVVDRDLLCIVSPRTPRHHLDWSRRVVR